MLLSGSPSPLQDGGRISRVTAANAPSTDKMSMFFQPRRDVFLTSSGGCFQVLRKSWQPGHSFPLGGASKNIKLLAIKEMPNTWGPGEEWGLKSRLEDSFGALPSHGTRHRRDRASWVTGFNSQGIGPLIPPGFLFFCVFLKDLVRVLINVPF